MHTVGKVSAISNRIRLLLIIWSMTACGANVAMAQAISVVETDTQITVSDGKQLIVAYNKVSPPAPAGINSVYERSGCLHPINSPRGRTVTQMFPFDHPHQQGVFSAWVNTTYDGQAVDFWNLLKGTGEVLHEKVVSTSQTTKAAGFEVDLIHRATVTRPVDVLRERWKVTVYPTDGAYHCFDLETTQTALTDKPLVIKKFHYGGLALRGPTRWLTAKDRDAMKRPQLPREPSEFVNNLGSGREKGNHQNAKWVALTGRIDNEPVTIAVLCHARNFRAPQPARLHPTKPYFCFAPCVHGDFVIDREHPFEARYRYLVTDTGVDAKWIQQQWDAWCSDG